jgi:hypothetical protein
VTVSFAVNGLAAATNIVLVVPAGIVTEAGTVRFPELDVRLTVAPVEALTVTVHVLEAAGPSVTGAHTRVLTETVVPTVPTTLTVPPVPVTEISDPVAEAPSALTTPIVAALLPASVTVKVATTPSPTVAAFIPQAMQS